MKQSIKILTFSISLMISTVCYSQVDSFAWCQKHLDAIKELSTMELTVLNEGRRQVSYANSVESLSKATGKNYSELVNIFIEKEGKTKEFAEKFIMEHIKPNEIYIINSAIEMHGVTDEHLWLEWYKECTISNH